METAGTREAARDRKRQGDGAMDHTSAAHISHGISITTVIFRVRVRCIVSISD